MVIHRARLGSREFRVLRPASPVRGVALRATGHWLMVLCTDSGEAMRIAGLWQLAARSRHSLVHIPLREDPEALADSSTWCGLHGAGPALDMLLAHHSLAMPPSRWKRVRGRLDRGRPHTADTGTGMLAEFEAQTGRPWAEAGSPDLLDLAVQADTAVVTGSAAALHKGAYPFLQLAVRGPGVVRQRPEPGWFSTKLHPEDGLLRRRSGLGIYLLYYSPWLDRRRAAATGTRPE